MTSKMNLLTGQSASTLTPTDRQQLLSAGRSALTQSAEHTAQSAQARATRTVTYTQSSRRPSTNTLTDAPSDNKVLAELMNDLVKGFLEKNLLTQRRMKSTDPSNPSALVFIISPELEALMRSG